MLIVTTAMFALGLIALVFNTQLSYQQFTFDFDPSGGQLWSPRRTSITTAVGATLTCMIVSGHPSIQRKEKSSNFLSIYLRAPLQLFRSSPRPKYILSFVVCAWRAAVLWNYDRRVVAVLVFFILGTIGKLSLQGETKEAFLMSHGPQLPRAQTSA